MKKRVLAFVLVLVMCFAMATPAFAASAEFEMEGTVLKRYRGKSGDVIIPDGVTGIGDYAFSSRSDLTSVVIPNSVTQIGNFAFNGCAGLTGVTIPNSVISIGGYAFAGCVSLTSVVIPSGITSIEKYAFSGCTGLTNVTIPDSVTSIGESAFSACVGLTNVTIPSSVTKLGGVCFSGCTGLTNVTIPDSVTSIGRAAFGYCQGLTSVTIPGGVTSIGDGAFSDCKELAAIQVDAGNQNYTSVDGTLFTMDMKTLMAYPGGKQGSYTVPDSVTSIGNDAFDGCVGLTNVTIPESVTSIGERAFRGCTGLAGVTIPNSVTRIGSGAFWDCTGLTSVTIPNSVTSIGDYAFCRCCLTSVTIPNSVTSIGRWAFLDCDGLKDVYYAGTEAQWKTIEIGEGNDPLDTAAIHYNSTASEQSEQPTITFTDVSENIYYAKPVAWAVGNKITKGTSSTAFSPDKTCTHAEILTFLWRAAGSPAPAEAVNSSEYYAKALQWAKEKGITSGTVSPDAPCLRGSVVDYMWKYAGAPTYSDTTIPFTDVDANSAMAVKWAFDNGVTKGSSSTTFSPDGTCTRGEIVTFLYRAFAE